MINQIKIQSLDNIQQAASKEEKFDLKVENPYKVNGIRTKKVNIIIINTNIPKVVLGFISSPSHCTTFEGTFSNILYFYYIKI